MKCSRFITYLVLLGVLVFPNLAGAGWWSKYKYYDSTSLDAVYITAALNFRSCPDTHCHVKGVLQQGEMVRLIRYKGRWAKVQLANGSRGWVSSKYLSSKPVAHYAPEPEERSVSAAEPTESEGRKSVSNRQVLYLDELTEKGGNEESQSELLDTDDIFN